MRLPIQWLEEVLGARLDVEDTSHRLTMGGLEVEHAEPVAGVFEKVVVAHVLSVAPHPNADKLRVTSVDAGKGSPAASRASSRVAQRVLMASARAASGSETMASSSARVMTAR